MEGTKNPFSNLYHTESISAEKFVEIFSPVLLRESRTHELFQPGSVILTGLQGAGKSALLNLLKPEVLIAYKNSDELWPLPDHCSKFLSASIVLRSSGALDFGQRPISMEADGNSNIVGLFFGDYLNYWIIDDLLSNIELLRTNEGEVLSRFLDLDITTEKLDNFAASLKTDSCWFGVLDEINDYKSLRRAIKDRILGYESFLNYNSDFPNVYAKTKSKPGVPIGCVAEALKKCQIIPKDLPVFITIDQFEDLMDLERDEQGNTPSVFRDVIIRMLGNRDKRVSYRVGARPYSLPKGLQGFGNNSFTEEMREFELVDIGKVLEASESRTTLFPEFCEDVLARRLKFNGFFILPKSSNLSRIFGKRASAEEKVKRFIGQSRQNVVSRGPELPAAIRNVLIDIAENDPISAKMGEAWVRQNIKKEKLTKTIVSSEPWQKRQWWKKERKQQALLQVFSACHQKLAWYGAPDVVLLSGKNIFVFLSLCQFVWAEYLRGDGRTNSNLPKNIDAYTQSIGIHAASEFWFRKVRAEPKGGDDRHRFINVLGTFLRDGLRNDKNMSYPGANGFSLSVGELEQEEYIESFLESCVAFGVLEQHDHTPKSKSRGQSQKWYLTSILTPHFQVPTSHTKEPYYASVSDVDRWMKKAKVISLGVNAGKLGRRTSKDSRNDDQLTLNFWRGEDD